MKKLILLSFMLLLFGACKTQRTIAPFILRDSISITYKQGREQPTPSQILCNPQRLAGDSNEQPSPSGLRGAQTAFRRNSSAPAFGKVGLGATREASVSEEALSERTKKRLFLPPTIIRVDTVFVERWHTTEVPSPPKPIPRFYKRCTWGFFILLLLIFGRIALRIVKAIYLRR